MEIGAPPSPRTGDAAPDAAAPPGGRTARVVLDTNVLLSLWVFEDNRFSPFRQAIAEGRWRVLSSPACHAEFERVLGYPMFGLPAERQASIAENHLALAETVIGGALPSAVLPLCKDRDDQKFLELARDGDAELLVTSDKALLKLARRKKMLGLFRIMTPENALGELGTASSGLHSTSC